MGLGKLGRCLVLGFGLAVFCSTPHVADSADPVRVRTTLVWSNPPVVSAAAYVSGIQASADAAFVRWLMEQMPVTNLVAKPEALASIDAAGAIVNYVLAWGWEHQKEAGVFATVSELVDQVSDNPAARLTAQEIAARVERAAQPTKTAQAAAVQV